MQKNQVDVVDVMVESPNFPDMIKWRDPKHGITALGAAVAWGYIRVVKIFLKRCK
jgi:hypothetical protein